LPTGTKEENISIKIVGMPAEIRAGHLMSQLVLRKGQRKRRKGVKNRKIATPYFVCIDASSDDPVD
jgi:hypothetical protein